MKNIIDASLLAKMFVQGSANLDANKEIVNALNVFPVPDGDTGTNMSMTMATAIEKLNQEFKTVDEVATVVSKGSLMGARGNSGVILSQIFRGFAKGCKGKQTLNVKDFCLALRDAQESAYSAVLKPIEGTILTVIREIAEFAKTKEKSSVSFEELFDQILERGEIALANTPNLLPVLLKAGVVDSGGKGLIFFLYGMRDALLGKTVKMVARVENKPQSHFETEDITFGYCTEFIIQGSNMDSELLKSKIEVLGDSLVFVKDDDLIKVHIHTDNPGVALQEALLFGSLVKVKIENMRLQHSELIDKTEDKSNIEATNLHDTASVNSKPEVEQEYAFVAVAAGQGMCDILTDLGVDYIIEGGQTMNPSTQDFLTAIDQLKAKNIILFPNNSNVILAAEQAKQVTSKNVDLIPTKNIPQCVSAIIAFDSIKEFEVNMRIMSEAIQEVETVAVTHSVRDTVMDGISIKEGDFISVLGGSIVASGDNLSETAYCGVESAIKENTELITIYYGEKMTEQNAEELKEVIVEKNPDVDVVLYYGGQPVYYYIISVE